MSKQDEARAFHYGVYEQVQMIPRGSVTTYGHIAKLVFRPNNSRYVGQALKFLPQDKNNEAEYPFHLNNVPWWRVINSSGGISPRSEGGVESQAQLLRQEGIEVSDDNKISLRDYGWFPKTEFDDYS